MSSPKRAYRAKARGEIARNMSAIRSTDNAAEVALRKSLHRLGFRYRLQAKSLAGRPDFVFPSKRVAVFVDGDFWHARLLRERGEAELAAQLRTSNRTYWIQKFRRRVQRDDEVTSSLTKQGWSVVRCWESEIRADLPGVSGRIARLLKGGIRARYQKPRRSDENKSPELG